MNMILPSDCTFLYKMPYTSYICTSFFQSPLVWDELWYAYSDCSFAWILCCRICISGVWHLYAFYNGQVCCKFSKTLWCNFQIHRCKWFALSQTWKWLLLCCMETLLGAACLCRSLWTIRSFHKLVLLWEGTLVG
jgi:hypothetical protein